MQLFGIAIVELTYETSRNIQILFFNMAAILKQKIFLNYLLFKDFI